MIWKYNPRNHQTLIIIVGNQKLDNENRDKIYYAMSKDMLYKSYDVMNQSIWRLSNIKLQPYLQDTLCMITHQNTTNPKLIILGGVQMMTPQQTYVLNIVYLTF